MAKKEGLSIFDKYLSVWVALCMILGALFGVKFPGAVRILSEVSIAHVSIPIAIVLWIMIFTMMVQIDSSKLRDVRKHPKALWITLVVNWLIKPFTMFFIAVLFFRYIFFSFIASNVASGYIAGAVLLGAAPCTAMVFVWSYLSGGDPNYTLAQVSINDLVVIVAYAPIVKFLLGLNKIIVPYSTVFYSVIIYVLVPVILGYFFRRHFIRLKGEKWLTNVFSKDMKKVTIAGLLATLIIIFMFQGKTIFSNPVSVLLIMVPLIIQTYFIFLTGSEMAKGIKIKYSLAAPQQ